MPRLLKTVIPRIKKSLAERGVMATLFRGPLLAVHLYREHRTARTLAREQQRSEFDSAHGVNTDGDVGGWTYLSDLDIPSPNWIYGRNYAGTEPERFAAVLAGLQISFEEFAFVDFGSGKGRVLLMASEFPFKKIVGIEFSSELHAIARQNIGKYSGPRQKCKSIESVCMDFIEFELPPEPCVLYFFDPCEKRVMSQVLERIRRSLRGHPRKIYLVYVAPSNERLLDCADFLWKSGENESFNFHVYENT
jgi:SAM-dependent methyltransferase